MSIGAMWCWATLLASVGSSIVTGNPGTGMMVAAGMIALSVLWELIVKDT